MRVHQADSLNACYVITILLIENVQVFLSKADRQRLGVTGTNIDIGKDG